MLEIHVKWHSYKFRLVCENPEWQNGKWAVWEMENLGEVDIVDEVAIVANVV